MMFPMPPLVEMPLLPITSAETLASCRSLSVSERDIFICSYPKSGTTWTQNLVCRLLSAHLDLALPPDWHLSHSAPFYEVDQYWESGQTRVPARTQLQKPKDERPFRIFNTHLRPHQLPRSAKCIYVLRDPLDVLASFYHHMSNMAAQDGGYTGTQQDFVVDFLQGTVVYGKWQDHIEAWLGNTNDSRCDILLLHYADMKLDLRKESKKVAKFLGVLDERLDDVVNQAIQHCTFGAMRLERWRYTPLSVRWKTDQKGKPYDNFVRTGRVGDGKEFLDSNENFDLNEQWQQDLEIARKRWRHVDVDESIVMRYLGQSNKRS